MKTTSLRTRALACALLATTAYCGLAARPAAAQSNAKLINTPAEKFAIAPGGVDMRTGRYAYRETDLSIGGEGESEGLALTRILSADVAGHVNPFANLSHNWDIMVSEVRGYDETAAEHIWRIYVHFGGRSQTYQAELIGFKQMSDGPIAPLTYTGDRLGPSVVYSYTALDGTIAVFRPLGGGDCSAARRCAYVSEIIEADGTKFSFDYAPLGGGAVRLKRVTSSRGYALLLEGSGNLVTRACVLNLAQVAAPADGSCPASAATASYGYTNAGPTRLATVTRPDGGVASFTYTEGSNGTTPTTAMGFIKPDQNDPWLTNVFHTERDEQDVPQEIIDSQSFADGQSYAYGLTHGPSVGTRPATVAGGLYRDALNQATIVEYGWPVAPGANTPGSACNDPPCPPPMPIPNEPTIVYQQTPGPVAITDPLGRTTLIDYCDPEAEAALPPTEDNRCYVVPAVSFTDPEGIRTELEYDGHRNVIRATRHPKPDTLDPDGSPPPAPIVTSAVYDTAHPKSAHKPLEMTDGRGNVTRWTYAPEHGGVLTETGPAVDGVVAQKRYTYGLRQARLANGDAAGPVIWVLTGMSFCRSGNPDPSGTGCALPGDEVLTTYDYGPPAGPGNLLLRGQAVTADGTTLRTCYAYDGLGRRISETSPNAGLAACPSAPPAEALPFTRSTRYDAMGRVTGTIAPDPDGPAGPLRHAAVRTTFDKAGRPVSVETGELAAWQSEAVAPADWAGFTALQRVDTIFDPLDRKLKESLSGIASAGGAMAVQTVTEHSYDLAGRLRCTAVRMNPDEFAVPPRPACTPGIPHPVHGPDRIAENVYDAAGQLVQSLEGVGTADYAVEATRAYNLNGQLTQLIDANGNRNEMRHDGFDRLACWILPSPATVSGYDPESQASALATAGSANGNCTDSGDFEYYRYDAAGNRTSLRNRAGEVLGFAYDALDRMISKDRPGAEPDVAYSWDLRGLQLSASFPATGESVTSAWDGFGRIVSSTTRRGGVDLAYSYQYDPDGNRTGLTHPDGAVFAYERDGLGRVAAIRHNGATLIGFGYDRLGRRTSLTRGDGSATSYDYDGASRLTRLRDELAGDGSDLTITMGYNPASQIASRETDNDLYVWSGHGNGSTASPADGLNRTAQLGGTTLGYDAKGNLTFDGTRSYAYDSENRLRIPAAPYHYDPLGRLAGASTSATGPLAIAYDNSDGEGLIAERTPGSLAPQRRHVFGPNVDEPLVWYEGSGTAAPRYLHADERGSIVAVTDAAGALLNANRYDEYGRTQSTNASYLSRFGYTGQRWFGGTGLHYYKARFYHPLLGRFMQVDPVGYDDQINLYAYVGNDPVNETDPTGEFLLPPDHRDPKKDWASRMGQLHYERQRRDPVKVSGGTPEQRRRVSTARDVVLSTPRGKKMQARAEYTFRQERIRITDRGGPSSPAGSGEMRINPDAQFTDFALVPTTEGLQRSSLEAFVAHELGHSVMGDEDDGPGHMNNIKRNENPVRRALNEPERTEY